MIRAIREYLSALWAKARADRDLPAVLATEAAWWLSRGSHADRADTAR